MTWPAVVFWILILWAGFSRGPGILYLLGISSAFGTLQMLPGDSLGGANVLPQSICAAVFVTKVFAQDGNVLRGVSAALDLRRLGLLALFLVYSVPVSMVLPRLFAGQIEVITLVAPISGPQLLQPTFNNITQSGYLALSVGTTMALSVVGSRSDFRRHYLISVLLGGIAFIVTGAADLITYQLGRGELLDPFRNVSYALLTDVETLGAKRVVGLMAEASSYGSLCVGAVAALLFLRPCFEPGLRRWAVPPTIAGLAFMAAISTSTSAYVGLVILAVVFGVNWTIRLTSSDSLAREGLGPELVIVVLAGFAFLAVLVLFPSVLTPVYDMLDNVVLRKGSSASYAERSSWTQTGWDALISSGGLGIGLGAVRTSNFFVAILSNTGVFGGALMFSFFLKTYLVVLRLRNAEQREWQRALKCTLFPSLVMGWFSGTTPDVGVSNAAMFGLLNAVDPTSDESKPPVVSRP